MQDRHEDASERGSGMERDFPAMVYLLEKAAHSGFSDAVFEEARTVLGKYQLGQKTLTTLRYEWGRKACTNTKNSSSRCYILLCTPLGLVT